MNDGRHRSIQKSNVKCANTCIDDCTDDHVCVRFKRTCTYRLYMCALCSLQNARAFYNNSKCTYGDTVMHELLTSLGLDSCLLGLGLHACDYDGGRLDGGTASLTSHFNNCT